MQLWFHYGPAHFVDLVYRLMGKKPFLVKVSSLMQKSTKALEPFTTNSWTWTHSNMDKLQRLQQPDTEHKRVAVQDRVHNNSTHPL